MQLQDLKSSLKEMSTQELLDVIRDMRASRTTPKEIAKGKDKKVTAPKQKREKSPLELMKSMTAEQQLALISQLEEELGDG